MLAYLDHAATTPLRPEAAEAMLPWIGERFGNPSGSHSVARAARAAVEEGREAVAEALGVEPGEVVFTSGGTEADNLAVSGCPPGAVVTSAVEHHAVLASAAARPEHRVVGVGRDGVIDLDQLEATLDSGVSLVSVMLVNNEVGTIQPLDQVAERVRAMAPQALLHTDAVQALSWLDVARAAAGADLISVSAHKFGGPQGAGALAVRGAARVRPILRGGGQERDRRAGTHNVAGIVGLAAAATATVRSRAGDVPRIASLRDRLAGSVLATVPGSAETGERASKVAGSCHLRFAGVASEDLLFLLDDAGVCASAGSACASGALEPSHVLAAMGVDHPGGALRLSLGVTTTESEVDLAAKVLAGAVERLRQA